MGGVVDCGLGIDAKTSPRRAAIEKAQAELQQEFDIREERRKELEFLKKGGNPLDFRTSHVASISLQSTSLTDQLAEPYFTSEAKSSFVLPASPHGDSVESSGRPGGSVGREPNIGDNLLLLDGESSKLSGERNVKHRGKRGSTTLSEQSSQVDGCNNVKEAEDSVIFRLGAKSQAYARRNRSRTSRDPANLGLTNSGSRHGNKPSIASSKAPCPRGTRGSLSEFQAEEHAVSSISNSKAASADDITIPKTLARDQVDNQLDMVQNNHTYTDMIIDGLPEGGKEVNMTKKGKEVNKTENLQGNDPNNQPSSTADKDLNGNTSQSCDVIRNDDAVGLPSSPLESNESKKDTRGAENINGFHVPDKTMTSLDDDDLCHKTFVADTAPKISNVDMREKHTCVNNTCNIHENTDCGGSDGHSKDKRTIEGISSVPDDRSLEEKNEPINPDAPTNASDAFRSVQPKDEVCDSRTEKQSEVGPVTTSELVKPNGEIICEPEKKIDNSCVKKSSTVTSSLVSSTSESSKAVGVKSSVASTTELQPSGADHKKAHEDAILKEAELIEARLKRAGELPTCNKKSEKRQKCHWDFVLEEMAWMANDFMQERLWKTAAASQVSRWIASSGRSKFEQVNIWRKQKCLARSLVKAVTHFWHEAQAICTGDAALNAGHLECKSDRLRPSVVNGTEVEREQVRHTVLDYAVRFLKHNSSISNHSMFAEAPSTPDRQNDAGILEISWEDQLSEETLFYTVPPGAMKSYRESMESQWMQYKKLGNSVHQDDCETSMCNSTAGGSRENVYEEDEGETGTYLLHGTYEGGLSSKFSHKKKKHVQQRSNVSRLNEARTDFSYEPCLESKSGNQPLILNGKRTSNAFNVGSIPRKRARTATRQRVVSPYPSGVIGPLQVTSKTDASSEDTSSFQDDQSSLHGGSMPRKNMGVESTMDFERQVPYDGNEISSKPKKKKKPKHLGYKNSLNLVEPGPLVVPGKGSSYEQRLQVDPMIQHEQKEHVKRRMESQIFDSYGGAVVYGQHAAKKPKLLKQLSEASPEALTPITGSFPSPVASQMSNMSNSNKLIKFVANRDRARKSKALKMAAGQSGAGSTWSNFEDQALVVLVHDMGPNWELVSDAINSTLQFKCIFRKPKECKERHKFLMDKSSGDGGGDSGEDSGSSQPYPSTLPGIPKGSARQLFQRLQGPMEEDILKTHFEKIILLGQRLSTYSRQNDSQETKQIIPVHNSHVVAFSQIYPNNLSGVTLTPLDFCESISSSPDVFPPGCQGSHTGSLAVPSHQSSFPSILPTSSDGTMLPGSPSIVLSSSLPSASAPLNLSSRDSQRYSVPRPSTLPVDDPQRMQQYSQMLPGRTHHQSSMSLPGALPMGVDHGVRMLSSASGMGMLSGMNRGMPMPRPFQGISSAGMLNMVSAGNMLSSGGHGVQNSVNVHPSAISNPGNSMTRPRDPLQMLRPGQNAEEHGQMMIQELQMKASQANGQPVPPFSGISATFSNATVPAPIQTFPVQQHQQSHQIPQQPHLLGNSHHLHMQGTRHSSPQPQVGAMRVAKERQLQHRIMPQLQHHISGPNAVSSIQNNSQIQQQSQSCSVSPVSSSQGHQKQQNISRNPTSGMSNQIIKQRQRQHIQQQQPRQQQQQSQQQAKLIKGSGRGNMLIHHNLSADASPISGFSTASKNPISEKHLMQQGQGFFPDSSGLNPTLHQPGSQTNIYPHSLPQSTKQMPPMSDTCNQGSAQSSPSHNVLVSQQAPISSSMSLPKQHQQPQQRYLNQSQQSIQRIVLQQSQMNSDGRLQSSTSQAQVTQIGQSASIPQSIDTATSAPVVPSATLWNPEPLYDANAPTPAAHVASSAQEKLAGGETLVSSSSHVLAPKQMSGGVSVHGHNTGRQWQQQQQQQPQPQQEQQHSKHQNQQMVQSDLHAQTSNLGPG